MDVIAPTVKSFNPVIRAMDLMAPTVKSFNPVIRAMDIEIV
jgi:hypothetical protein